MDQPGQMGFEVREVTTRPELMQPAKVVQLPVPPVGVRSSATAQRNLVMQSQEAQTLQVVMQKGAALADKQFEMHTRQEFHDGQMLYQQGESEKTAGEGTKATMAGFLSMEAATAADAEFAKGAADIERADKELTPELYRQKRQDNFKQTLSGNPILDDYMGKLMANVDTKLVGAQVQAHTEWKLGKTINAATNLLVSKAGLLKNGDDAKIVQDLLESPDSPLTTLSEENRRKAVLDAVVISLDQEKNGLLQHFGGVAGIQAKFSPSAAELSAITRAEHSYKTAMQNKYNAGFERASHEVITKVLTGGLTYEQGMAAMEAVSRQFGASDAQMKAGAGAVASIDLGLIRQKQAEMRQAAHEEAKAAKVRDNAQYALATNTLPLLDEKTLVEAMNIKRQEIAGQVQQSPDLTPTDMQGEFSSRYAQFLNKVGLVDPSSSKMFTATFSGTDSILDSKGEVSPIAIGQYRQLMELDKINPALARQHLKTEQARTMFALARDYDVLNMDSEAALKSASMSMKAANDLNLDLNMSSKENKEAVRSAVKEVVASPTGGLFGVGGLLGPGGLAAATGDEIDKAMQDRQFVGRAERLVAAKMIRNPSLTPQQAAQEVVYDMAPTTAYVMGTMVNTPHGEDIYKVMGIPDYRSMPGAPNEAMQSYLSDHGSAIFGAQFNDTKIFGRGSGSATGAAANAMLAATRGTAYMDVRMTERNGQTLFQVAPILSDGTVGGCALIDPQVIGAHYKKKLADSSTERLSAAEVMF